MSRPERCAECGGTRDAVWILHNVRHKGSFRLLCTHCLLSSFRGHFCPVCLDVFVPLDEPQRASKRAICLHCPSTTHLSCLSPNPNSNATHSGPSDQFRCPLCADPGFRFFRLEDGGKVVKKEGMRAVVAAARIAAETVRKGAATAKAEAEKRVKEAAVARKRAREALERVAYLSMKEKEKKGVVLLPAKEMIKLSNGKDGEEDKVNVRVKSSDANGLLASVKEEKEKEKEKVKAIGGNQCSDITNSNHGSSNSVLHPGVPDTGAMTVSAMTRHFPST